MKSLLIINLIALTAQGQNTTINAKRFPLEVPPMHTNCFPDDNHKSTHIQYRELKYSDFKGHGERAALTTTEVNLIEEEMDGRFTFEVECVFIPEESWINVKTPEILKHENLHFSIAHLFAEKLRAVLPKFQHCDSLTAIVIRSYYNQQMMELEKEQQQYDQETQHSQDTTAQKSWQLRINQELKN